MSTLAKRSDLPATLNVPEEKIDEVFSQFRVPRIGIYYHAETVRSLIERIGKRQCVQCGQWKPKTEFWRLHSRNSWGEWLNGYCAVCRDAALLPLRQSSEVREREWKARRKNKTIVTRVIEKAPTFFAATSLVKTIYGRQP